VKPSSGNCCSSAARSATVNLISTSIELMPKYKSLDWHAIMKK
jgi:hypothetical protein